MKKIYYSLLIFIIYAAVVIAPLFYRDAFAETCRPWVAKAVSVEGSIQARKASETEWRAVKMWDEFCPGDMVRLLGKSRAAIVLVNGVILRLDENTTITFRGMERDASLVEILKGVVNFFSRWPRSLKVYTPFVNGTVEGTEFLVKVDDKRTFISVFEGHVTLTNGAGSIVLTDGRSATAKAGQSPAPEIVVQPRDAVRWALYYPPVIYAHPEKFGKNDPRFYTCRASSLLHVGRVDEATADIGRALKIDPRNAQAFALQSVIAVVQNEKEKALSFAKRAVGADPRSASALLALSYAQQAGFDLKGSLISLNEAVKAEPENALVWARLAEMRMSFGELDRALEAANKAVVLNPYIAGTQTVLGFAYLAEVKIEQSKEAFENAIELDKAAPLPRLGVGLAKIRDGNLAEGRKEIEIAVSLDPDNSLIRSYLGKAFYEEKRDKMAEEQFSAAKKFDPKDPTPYFYDAIRKQSINRPVEALYDMQRALELNDDRAVYRSKLLLDSDLAARSASLARIYTDLGFQDVALVEGWKSVNTDPADFSGHRFLADSYAALPRHEIARVSELLQSQLLQPINIAPVQPELAESNLSILNGAGPSDLSFNEFNPLFNRNRYALQLAGVAGGEGTLGNEIVVSGVQGKVSFSVGQFHYETDGFRKNDDQKQNIYNVFAQVELSPQTSVQTELRYRDFKHGDLLLFFDPDSFNPDERDKEYFRSARLGLHHSFSPNSDLIVSLIYRSADFDYNNVFGPGFDVKESRTGYTAEVQHLFRAGLLSIISGVGHFQEDQDDVVAGQSTDTHPRHTNIYAYSLINYPENVTLTIGGSANFLKTGNDGSTPDSDEFNPKFGITWNPFKYTTLRLAAFRTLNRQLLTDQTIEPTQVAGFNQFFDDVEGTKAWRYGMGVDQKFCPQVYGGGEFSRRDLEVPGFILDESGSTKLIEGDWEEELGRAYIYWTPHPWLALSTEYQYEHFERPEKFAADNITRLNTRRLIFGIGFFHPSGFNAQFKPAYISQNGKFVEALSPFETRIVPKEDQFWDVDASIGYRLPKRLGLFTVVVKNLFNKEFNFQDTDPRNPLIQPKRLILAKLTLSF